MSTRPAIIAAALIALAVPAGAHAATDAPSLVRGQITAKRISTPKGAFVAFGAVVKLDRELTGPTRSRFGLITAPWSVRKQIADGVHLPDNLFGGTSLGRIGKASRHCYVAEVAQVTNHTSVRFGSTWKVAVHDGNHAIGSGLRLRVGKASETNEGDAARALGCYA
jgi:hypothetical protein